MTVAGSNAESICLLLFVVLEVHVPFTSQCIDKKALFHYPPLCPLQLSCWVHLQKRLILLKGSYTIIYSSPSPWNKNDCKTCPRSILRACLRSPGIFFFHHRTERTRTDCEKASWPAGAGSACLKHSEGWSSPPETPPSGSDVNTMLWPNNVCVAAI